MPFYSTWSMYYKLLFIALLPTDSRQIGPINGGSTKVILLFNS